MCRNDYIVELDDELSWLLFTKDSELFILFAENSQILLKIYVIPILLTCMYLVALESVTKQPIQLIIQLNSSLRQIIDSNNCRSLPKFTKVKNSSYRISTHCRYPGTFKTSGKSLQKSNTFSVYYIHTIFSLLPRDSSFLVKYEISQ